MTEDYYTNGVEVPEEDPSSGSVRYSSDHLEISREIVRMALATECKNQLLKVKDIKDTTKYNSRSFSKSSVDFINILGLAEKQLEDLFGYRLLRVPVKAANAKNEGRNETSSRRKRMRTEEETTNTHMMTAAQEDRHLYAEHPEAVIPIPGTDPQLPTRHGPHPLTLDAFILRSCLPPEFRIIVGSCLPAPEKKYLAIVSIIVSTIALRGGSISKQDLINLFVPIDLEALVQNNFSSTPVIHGIDKGPQEGTYTPSGSKLYDVKTLDDVFKIMESDQYLVKEKLSIRDSSGVERNWITYMLGKRARREFTVEGVLEMLKNMMGNAYTETSQEQAKEQLFKACLPTEAGLDVTW